MQPFIQLALISSISLYIIVIALVVSMIVDRNVKNISMLQIFGYNTSEIKTLFISGLMYLIIAALLVAIPLAKWFADIFCPYVYVSIPIGMFMQLEPWLYAIIAVGSILIFEIVLAVLSNKIRRVDYSAVLRER